MAVVDPDEVVEVTVIQKWVSVHVIHDNVEDSEGDQTVDGECYPLWSDEGPHLFGCCLRGFCTAILRSASSSIIQPPDNRGRIDERVYLEVHREAQ